MVAKTVSPSVESRKAQLASLQQTAQATFRRNMITLQRLAPALFERFIHYEAKRFRLSFSDTGYLEIIDARHQKKLYTENPVTVCQQQVTAFKRAPLVKGIGFTEVPVLNTHHIFPKTVNALIDELNTHTEKQTFNTHGPIGFLIVCGSGMGYHLNTLINELDIRNLCLYETHADRFYASLHTVDWESIFTYFNGNGRTIRFYIETPPEQTLRDIRTLRDTLGLHQLVYTHIFRHFNGPEEDAFLKKFVAEHPLIAGATGYVDDERISLAHTVNHLQHGCHILNDDAAQHQEAPVFIIGNGPSLDNQIAYIQRHQNHAVLISCGTTLSSLYKAGIKPHFHIETERTAIIKDYLEAGTNAEYRKGITLLCLNTVSPAVTDLFDQFIIAFKPNDIGEMLFRQKYATSNSASLTACNPTVTNAGLSFALSMGFSHLVLLGIDLGIPSGSSHHASYSIHYDIERKTKRNGFTSFEDKSLHRQIDANFGGTVATHPILYDTKINMELLIMLRQQQGPKCTIFNPSHGAKINGTQATPLDKLPDFLQKTIVPKKLHDSLLNKCTFYKPTNDITQQQLDECLRELFQNEKHLLTQANVSNSTQLVAELERIHTVLLQMKEASPIAYQMMRGSINFLFAIITRRIRFLEGENHVQNTWGTVKNIYNAFVTEALENLRHNLLQLDDTTNTTVRHLHRKT